ncbi:O-methyltransferase [Vibrio vulnificus]|uniref:O-methyltransferase n=1 Tax=Vibrio vulnificus TaxID=672 RepID=UPI001A1ABC68|nr:class I SAM-dependent methyltransferase [Vibrio vulnificus]MCA0772300.1 class I SAM-dependent methyltransferase [Vibrio vulnificus]HAS6244560.1 methyltransferase domain-containing protein [Vibrio vulnificus]HDY7947086.1 class I SAM-dependent methyltransferase [Vibrio vulnificus]
MNETVEVYPKQYEAILKATHAIGFPQLSELPIGAFLAALAASKQSGCLLELGTGTGLCTSWILHGMSADSKLTTVDNSVENIDIARRYLGADPRIDIVLSNGEDVIDRTSPLSVDLIFADTWPGKYHYLDEALACLKIGGFYIIDDMQIRTDWSESHNEKVRALIEHLSQRDDLVVAKLCWSTGIVICVKVA